MENGVQGNSNQDLQKTYEDFLKMQQAVVSMPEFDQFGNFQIDDSFFSQDVLDQLAEADRIFEEIQKEFPEGNHPALGFEPHDKVFYPSKIFKPFAWFYAAKTGKPVFDLKGTLDQYSFFSLLFLSADDLNYQRELLNGITDDEVKTEKILKITAAATTIGVAGIITTSIFFCRLADAVSDEVGALCKSGKLYKVLIDPKLRADLGKAMKTSFEKTLLHLPELERDRILKTDMADLTESSFFKLKVEADTPPAVTTPTGSGTGTSAGGAASGTSGAGTSGTAVSSGTDAATTGTKTTTTIADQLDNVGTTVSGAKTQKQLLNESIRARNNEIYRTVIDVYQGKKPTTTYYRPGKTPISMTMQSRIDDVTKIYKTDKFRTIGTQTSDIIAEADDIVKLLSSKNIGDDAANALKVANGATGSIDDIAKAGAGASQAAGSVDDILKAGSGASKVVGSVDDALKAGSAASKVAGSADDAAKLAATATKASNMSKMAKAIGPVALVIDLAWLSYGAYSTALKDKNDSLKNSDIVRLTSTSLSLVGNAISCIPHPATMIAGFVIGGISAVMYSCANIADLNSDSTPEEIGSTVGDAILPFVPFIPVLGPIAVGAASAVIGLATLPLMLIPGVGSLVMAANPFLAIAAVGGLTVTGIINAEKIRHARNDAKTWIDRSALSTLYDISALDATPIVNWFSGVYTPKMKKDKMNSLLRSFNWSKSAFMDTLTRDRLYNMVNLQSKKNEYGVAAIRMIGSMESGNHIDSIFTSNGLGDYKYCVYDYTMNAYNNRGYKGMFNNSSNYGFHYSTLSGTSSNKKTMLMLNLDSGYLSQIDNKFKNKNFYDYNAQMWLTGSSATQDVIVAEFYDVFKKNVIKTYGDDDTVVITGIKRYNNASRQINAEIDGGDGVDTLDISKIGESDNETIRYNVQSNGIKITDSKNNRDNIMISNFETIKLAGNKKLTNIFEYTRAYNGKVEEHKYLNLISNGDTQNTVRLTNVGDFRLNYIAQNYSTKGVANTVFGTMNTDYMKVDNTKNAAGQVKVEFHGGGGDDYLFGGAGDDKLYGDAGNDWIEGGGGINSIDGGAGDDVIKGSDKHFEYRYRTVKQSYYTRFLWWKIWKTRYVQQRYTVSLGETLYGGDGNDKIFGMGGYDTLYGGRGDDILVGGAQNDKLYGGEDNDVLYGGGGSDSLYGENGNDVLAFSDGNSFADGGNGLDTLDLTRIKSNVTVNLNNSSLRIGSTNYYNKYRNMEYLTGSAGHDNLTGFTNQDNIISGYDGNDTIRGGSKQNILDGGKGNDTIYAGNARDMLIGGEGRDTIYAYAGDDIIQGDEGNDTIYGGDGNDVIYGFRPFKLDEELDDNSVVNFEDNDRIWAGAGDDVVNGGYGNDTIYGESGEDSIYGMTGNDTIFGGSGIDWIEGGQGNDIIYGDDGDDNIFGGEGNDILVAGRGDDMLIGGQGNDTFIFDASYGNQFGRNYIADEAGSNKIEIRSILTSAIKAVKFGSNLFIGAGGASYVRAADFFNEDETMRYELKIGGNTLSHADLGNILTQTMAMSESAFTLSSTDYYELIQENLLSTISNLQPL